MQTQILEEQPYWGLHCKRFILNFYETYLCGKLFLFPFYSDNSNFCLFVCLGLGFTSQSTICHVGMFSLVETVLSNEDEAFCSRTQHCSPGEIQTRDLAISTK